jgi:tetratricopeptide (TPR) repeat protein
VFQIGVTHGRLKERDKALENYERARDLQTEWLIKYEDSAQSQSSLGIYLHNLGNTYRDAGRLDESEATLRAAVKHHGTSVQRAPGSAEMRLALSSSYAALGTTLRLRNKIGEAVDVTCQRQKLWTKEPKELVLVARDLAKCAALVGKDKQKLTDTERAEQDRIADLALAALRQAGELGHRDWKDVESAAVFAPLRGRPALQELLGKYKM